jgi:hypothetical protein
MRWSWKEYISTPVDVVEAVGRMIADDALAAEQRALHSRMGRR